MPYTDGLGAAIANTSKVYGAPRGNMATKVASITQRPVAMPFRPMIVPVLKMPVGSKHDGFPAIRPNIAPPVVDFMPLPQTPTIVSQGVPYPAAGGGQVTSGAPSPVLLAPAPTADGDVMLDDSTPSQARMSPLVMLVLAGLAVGFLLKKKR